MLSCPRCHTELLEATRAGGVTWTCDHCHGRVIGIAPLRRIADESFVRQVWGAGFKAAFGRLPCPACQNAMLVVNPEVKGQPLELDLCRRCELVWFDQGEIERVPPHAAKPHVLGEIDETKMPVDAREKLARIKVEQMAEQQRQDSQESFDNLSSWRMISALMGMPVEANPDEEAKIPWASWALSGIVVLVSLWGFWGGREVFDRYGFVPAHPWRDHGLTLATSFFLHAGFFHLITNLYFLIGFGGAVENSIGRVRWLLLLLVSTVIAELIEVLIQPTSLLPLIGASGGISGLLAFYALQFPHARIGILFRYFLSFQWTTVPARRALLGWVALQVWGAIKQYRGFGNVASIAHLGGALGGVAGWLLYRMVAKRLAIAPKTEAAGSIPVSIVK